MLRPRHRQVYLDALQAPLGFTLDQAVGTTFSLDLPTLLAVPLGFAMLHWENAKGELSVDPVTLLHALRRCADRVTVFCQEGQIAAPAKHHPLFAYLEPMITQVRAPDENGLFHAKTWLLRFTDGDSVAYRFICLSRNITRDRSWDTLLALDGPLTERRRAFSRNHPLGDFVSALPGMGRLRLEPGRSAALARMADEVRRVDFQAPEGFEELAFWPMGLAGPQSRPLEGRVERLLVVSPYLSEGFLRQLADPAKATVISCADSLEALAPAVLEPFRGRLYVLADAALGEDEDEWPGDEEAGQSTLEGADVRGLHAKLFVADDGWNSSVWTGSANATSAAFNRNVEFLVQLRGKKRSGNVGIDAFLGSEADPGFRSLLREFNIGDRQRGDPELKANEELVESARRRIAGAGLRVRVQQRGGAAHDLAIVQPEGARVSLDEVKACCWPATLNRSMAQDVACIAREGSAVFSSLTLYALTAFICFEVAAGEGETRVVARFALSLPLEGAPQDRLDQIMSSVLGNRDRLLRYILFLVSGDDAIAGLETAFLARSEAISGGALTGAGYVAPPLLEELMRALARSPEKLDAVARLVADLRRTTAGSDLLPPHFESIWEPIWKARLAQKGTAA